MPVRFAGSDVACRRRLLKTDSNLRFDPFATTEDTQMVLREIVQTCSNAEVAKAALASIGGKFAEHVAAEASRSNLTPGMLTSLIVKEFSANASFDQMADIDVAASGTDQPVLSGLREILIQSAVSKIAPVENPAPEKTCSASALAGRSPLTKA